MNYKLINVSEGDIDRLINCDQGGRHVNKNVLSNDLKQRLREFAIKTDLSIRTEYRLIVSDEKIIGYLMFREYEDEDGCLIDDLYIKKSFRNGGIGTDIIRILLSTYKTVGLYVIISNTNAINLFERFGLKITKQVCGKYFMSFTQK